MKRYTRIAFLGLLFLCLAQLPFAQDINDRKPVDSITIAELKDHMYFLASDELCGRRSGSEGFEIAAMYASSQFRASGLKPIIKANGGLTYLQAVPMYKASFGTDNALIVKNATGEQIFIFGDHYLILPFGAGVPESSINDREMIFVGYGICEPEAGWDDYENIDVNGKVVISFLTAPEKDGEPVLPPELHSKYLDTMQSGLRKIETAGKHGAAAIAFVPNMEVIMSWNMMKRMIRGENISYDSAGSGENGAGVTVLLLKTEVVNAMFAGEDLDPIAFQNSKRADCERFALINKSMTLRVDYSKKELPGNNVVAFVAGTDPESADQYITVGAHLDHVGIQNGRVYNGADDNASGSVGVIEIAEAVAMNPPRRPVVFVLYVAEEEGLIGSRHFISDCPVPIENVMVNVNLDMIGRTGVGALKSHAIYALGADKVTPQLQEILDEVNDRTVKWPLNCQDPANFFQHSDHYNFHRLGIPTVMFWSGMHKDLHQPTDDVDKIEFDKMQKVAQLIYELVMELGNRDEPLVGKKEDL